MAAPLHALLRARCRLALRAHLTPLSRPAPFPPHRHHANFLVHAPLAAPARTLAARASRKKDAAAAAGPLSTTPDAMVAGAGCGDGKVDAATVAAAKDTKMVRATRKGAAVLDPHIPDDMKKSWHVLQAGNEIYDATLNQNRPTSEPTTTSSSSSKL